MSVGIFSTAAHAVALLLAGALYRRTPSAQQRTIVVALAALLACDLARYAAEPVDVGARLATYAAGGTPAPYVGWDRWTWSARTEALWLWYIVSAWGVLAVLRLKRPESEDPRRGSRREPTNERSRATRAILLAAPALLVTLFALYPVVRGPRIIAVAEGVFLLSLAAQFDAVIRFAARGRWPDDVETVALLLAASSLASVAGTWRGSHPVQSWYVGQIPSALAWAFVAGWEIRCLIRARRVAP